MHDMAVIYDDFMEFRPFFVCFFLLLRIGWHGETFVQTRTGA